MPYPNEHAARLKEPSQFIRFARMNGQGGAGVDFIVGFKKGGGSEVQAIRFSKDKFTADEAKKWLTAYESKHKVKAISFDAAAGDAADHSDFAEGSKLEDWFEVAKTGAFPQGELTEKIFDEVVSKFNPEIHEPPVTLGHIRSEHNDKPSVGWVAGLKRIGSTLYAKAKQVAGDFDVLVREGRFKKRSIGIRWDDDGKAYLHHLAFLGASVPAVKGLRDIYDEGFYSDENETSQKEFSYSTERNLMVKEFTEKEISDLQEKAANEATAKAGTEFAEKLKTETKAAADKAAAETKAAVEKEFADKAVATKAAADYAGDVESMLKEFSEKKKLNPAQIANLRPVLLAIDGRKELTFSEKDKDDKVIETKKTVLNAIKAVIANFGEAPEGEFKDTKEGANGKDAQYSEEKTAAEKIMKDDPKMTYGQALIKARAQIKSKK